MSTTFYTESQTSTALRVPQEDASCEIHSMTRESTDTLVEYAPTLESRQPGPVNNKLCKPNCVTSLAEQQPYYLARATAAEELWKRNAGVEVCADDEFDVNESL
jgi:hypothetical protein